MKSQSIVVEDTQQGLCLFIENAYSTAQISLFGGHSLSFINKADGQQRLWLSKLALFDGKTPIRGGVPICWPWFSAHATHAGYPSHGFVRSQYWQLADWSEKIQGKQIVSTQIVLIPTQLDLFGFSNLHVKLVITIDHQFTLSLVSQNSGKSPVSITQALHSYLQVDNIRNVELVGIDGQYNDKVCGEDNINAPSPYEINQEVDRIHRFEHVNFTQSQQITLKMQQHDNTNRASDTECTERRLSQVGHNSTVVWNPWQDRCVKMHDMNDDGYHNMLCIEAANTPIDKQALTIQPHQAHTLTQIIS